MDIISAKGISYKFHNRDESGNMIDDNLVLEDINLDIKAGEFIAILGHNGSGKSTFAKHMNALLLPTEGTIYIDGEDTSSVDELWKIRQKCGMVFQNPDNQIVGTTVEEDVGFGPENLGIESEEIWKRVREALDCVDMGKHCKKSPNKLSGGQKQRVAIASSLAMKPKCIVLDEPTAMLDPSGRKDVMKILEILNKEEKMTIVLITHHMDEAVKADRIFVIDEGKIVLSGTPRKVFSNIEEIKRLKLDVPQIMELSYELYKKGIFRRFDILYINEFIEEYRSVITKKIKDSHKIENNEKFNIDKKVLLELKDVSYSYETGTAMQVDAVKNICFKIHENEFIGIMGHTGSGKSTLIQMMNGLVKPTSGEIYYNGENIHLKSYNKKDLHCKVGLVFQYPESQLFEENVIKDVMFGPLNKGFSKSEALEIVKKSLEMLEIGEEYYKKSPFELSGGEKRRIAIAGVIAMNPDIIILDEPTAGLDPKSRNNLLNSLKKLKNELNKTIIIVSHNMEDLANYVERVIVINNGCVEFDDDTKSVFTNVDRLEKIGLAIPQVTYAMRKLYYLGYDVDKNALTIKDALRGMKIDD